MGTTPITTARQKVEVIHRDISAFDWHKASARKITHSVSKMRTTGLGKKVPLSGETDIDNITTEAMLVLPEMAGFLAALKAGNKFSGATIVVKQFDVDGVEEGKDEWFDCMVVSAEWPEADANNEGGDPASLVIEWAVAS